jgi:hypothetical protein
MKKGIADLVALKLDIGSKEYEVLRMKADELPLPDDIQKLIDCWTEGAESLPDELPQKNYILKMLSAAQGAFERDDIRNVRFWILKAHNNIQNAKDDLVLYKRIKGNSIGGKANKSSHWAEDLAEYLVGLGLTFPKAWAAIPDEWATPLHLDDDTDVSREHIDGVQKLVARDAVGGEKMRPQSYSNFRDRYFYPAKKKS